MYIPFAVYKARLKDDLDDWSDQGLISEQSAREVLSALGQSKRGFNFAGLFMMLGAIVLCFGIITFVAANWDGMAKLARLVVLFSGLWAAYGLCFMLLRAGHSTFGHTVALLASVLYGASIMLIAQTYHMNGNPPDAVLLWAIGAGLAAVLLRSSVVGWLTFGLLTLWSCWVMTKVGLFGFMFYSDRGGLHWPFLIGWLVLVGCANWQNWYGRVHMAGISLAIWLTFGVIWNDVHTEPLLLAANIVIAISFSVLRFAPANKVLGLLRWDGIFNYATLIGVGLFIANSLGRAHSPFYGAVGLFVGIAFCVMARMVSSTFAAVMGYVLFAYELIFLYFKTFGTLIDTAAFFASAGGLLIVVAIAAYWLERKPAPEASA